MISQHREVASTQMAAGRNSWSPCTGWFVSVFPYIARNQLTPGVRLWRCHIVQLSLQIQECLLSCSAHVPSHAPISRHTCRWTFICSRCRRHHDSADGWVFRKSCPWICSSSRAIPLLGPWLETGLLGLRVIVDGKLLMFLMMPIT